MGWADGCIPDDDVLAGDGVKNGILADDCWVDGILDDVAPVGDKNIAVGVVTLRDV